MEEKRLVRASRTYGDLHLGAGAFLPDGKPNVLEDFRPRIEEEFRKHVKTWLASLPPEILITLRFNGDVIDFHAIPYRGKYGAFEADEDAAVEKFATCLKGHPRFFGLLREILEEHANLCLVWIIGNHDHACAWPSVQAKIREAVGLREGDDRLRFLLEEQDGDILYTHGNWEPANAFADGKTDEERLFMTSKVGVRRAIMAAMIVVLTGSMPLALLTHARDWTLRNILVGAVAIFAMIQLLAAVIRGVHLAWTGEEKRFLNLPYGSIMNAWLGMHLRRFQPWIGRMQNHGPIWFFSAVHDWRFAFIAGPLLLIHIFVWRFVVDQLHIRRRAKLRRTLQILATTTQADEMEPYVRKLAEHRPDVKIVVAGHTHVAHVQTLQAGGRDIVSINTGTCIEQVRVEISKVDARTRWPRLEAFFRRIGVYWRKKPISAFLLILFHLGGGALGILFFRWLGLSPAWTWGMAIFAIGTLLMRQSYGLYFGETFLLWTPFDTRDYDDGSREADLMKYDAASDAYKRFLDP